MTDDTASTGLPDDVLVEAERLTRLARNAVDANERAAYRERRDRLLESYDYTARVRDADDTLVCHPTSWLDDGVVRTEHIDDLDEAVEVSLSGPGDPDDWAAVDARNRELVEAVRDAHGEVHAANAAAFADFMGNHYAKPMVEAAGREVDEFLAEYFVRNAWPTGEQRAVVDRSIELVFETAGRQLPPVAHRGHDRRR